jgi:hypothetical protein
MPLRLDLSTPEDLPEIVKHQFAAFHPQDVLHALIYPSPEIPTEEVLEKTVARQRKYWDEDPEHVTWIKVRLSLLSSGEIFSCVIWNWAIVN